MSRLVCISTQSTVSFARLVVPFFGSLFLAINSWALDKTFGLYVLFAAFVACSIKKMPPTGPDCEVTP